MRFLIELAGIPIGTTDVAMQERAVGTFEPVLAYAANRVVFREGGNALWDLLTRPRQTAPGRRWRARLVARMLRRAEGLGVRTAAGIPIYGVRVFLFDSVRVDGPPIVVIHFGEALAGVLAEARPAGQTGVGPRPAA